VAPFKPKSDKKMLEIFLFFFYLLFSIVVLYKIIVQIYAVEENLVKILKDQVKLLYKDKKSLFINLKRSSQKLFNKRSYD